MSFMPIVIPAMMWNLAQYYWPVTLLGIVVLFVLMSHYPDRKKQILSWCVVSLSVILSIFLYHAVSTAREDEFTG